MKTKYIFLPIITIAAFYFSACQKDFTIDGVAARADSTVTPVVGDSVYLSRYINYDTYSTGNDTGLRISFSYDNMKRVSNIMDTGYESGVTNPPISFSKTEYFYNGLDSLPYKSVTFSKTTISGNLRYKDTITSFFYFNGIGKLILDSSISSKVGYLLQGNNTFSRIISQNIQRINYTGNKIYGLRQFSFIQNVNGFPNNYPYTRKDTATLDGMNNVISSNFRKDFQSPGSGYIYETKAFTYDNKISPFYKINIKYIFNVFSLDESDLVQNNNISSLNTVSISSANNNPFVNFYNYGVFSYHQNGFLSLVVDSFNTPISINKTVFSYTAL